MKDFGRGVGFSSQAAGEMDKDFSRGVIQKALNKAFAPEFLNRVDDIIMFDQLDKDAIHKIIDIELQDFTNVFVVWATNWYLPTRQKISLQRKATMYSLAPVR